VPSKGKIALALAGVALGAFFVWNWKPKAEPPVVTAEPSPPPTIDEARKREALHDPLRKAMTDLGLILVDEWLVPWGEEGWSIHVPRHRSFSDFKIAFLKKLESFGFSAEAGEVREAGGYRAYELMVEGRPVELKQASRPGLAIVIDDWGYHLKVLDAMKKFPGKLTIAVLPTLDYTRQIANEAHDAGHEVIVHLPMEPEHDMPMIKGTLRPGMTDTEAWTWTEKFFRDVPYAVGFNNHEGSKGSSDPRLVKIILDWQRQENYNWFYVLDSKTSPKSVLESEARKRGFPYLSRRIFLDNQDVPESIAGAFRAAVALAKKNGACVAIGHPKKNTFDVLAKLASEAEKDGVDLVPASELTQFDLAAVR
jgi:polysaccharide deacetylase 2 family uncharacterized protein YibQ